MKTSQSGTMPDESDQLTGFTVSPRLGDDMMRSESDSPRFGADATSPGVRNEGSFNLKAPHQPRNTIQPHQRTNYQNPSDFMLT